MYARARGTHLLPHTLPAWVLAHVVIISADPRLRDCHYQTID